MQHSPCSPRPAQPSARTPLLAATHPAYTDPDASDASVCTDQHPNELPSFASELRFLFTTSVPVMAAYLLQNSIQSVTIAVAGRLGPDEVAAAAFTMMLATVTGWCIALGGTTALDTLGSQSYTYAGHNPAAILPHLIRCIVLLWLLLLPVLVLWFFIAPVLLVLGQPERLSYDVQAFLRVLIFGAPAYVGFESVKKYLQCQGIMHASTLVLLVMSPLNALLSYVLVHRTRLALLGAPLAISITYHLCFLLLVAYARWGPGPPHPPSETPPARHASRALSTGSAPESLSSSSTATLTPAAPAKPAAPAAPAAPAKPAPARVLALRTLLAPAPSLAFLRLALPGILMVATEWWAFEIVALAAGRLGGHSVAAQGVLMTADQALNTFPFGLSVAASARIGNLIGARRAAHARRSAHAAALLSVALGGVVMTALLAGRNAFAFLFSADRTVAAHVARIMPLVASFQVADGLANACGGVLRGQGRQHLGAAFNVVAYYVLALPLGLALAFHFGLGLGGLWAGQVVALFLVGGGEYAVVWRFTDWDAEVRRGVARASA